MIQDIICFDVFHVVPVTFVHLSDSERCGGFNRD